MKTSKAFHALEQKIIYFDDDLELIDIIKISSERNLLSKSDDRFIFTEVNPEIHRHITRRKNSNGSRQNVIFHLRQTIYSSYIKDLYEEFSDYLRKILTNVSLVCHKSSSITAEKIIGKTLKTNFTAEQLLNCGNWEKVVGLIIGNLFQALENERSTKGLIKQVLNKLDITISDDVINAAMPFLDARHILVHADGKISEEFKSIYPSIKKTHGGYIKLDLLFCNRMKSSLLQLAKEIDTQIIQKDILPSEYIHPAEHA